jgi:TolB-like protein/DNA-binding winged helix-turn-helix (wHTH) protein
LLLVFVHNPGRLLTKDELMEAVWPGRYIEEGSLTQAIFTLRKALDDPESDESCIVTAAGRGYTFAAPVERIVPPSEAAGAITVTSAAVMPPPPDDTAIQAPPTKKRRQLLPALAVGAAVCASLALIILVSRLSYKPAPHTSTSRHSLVDDSVAVLPFVNMSGDPAKEYFSDGFSEELINDLSNEPQLHVASRTSSFSFKGRYQDIESIAHALRVHAVVEGSVREAGDRVRITAQLIDAGNGYHLWSASYDRNLTDILSLEDELARTIAAQLTHRLAPAAIAFRPKIDPAVYRLFLQGEQQYYQGTPQGWSNAAAAFKQVTARAADFADGFAWLSRAHVQLGNMMAPASGSDFTIAVDAAQRALSLDPRNVLARMDRAILELYAWDWHASASDLRALRAQNPNADSVMIGLWNYYTYLGFPDEAFAAWQRLSAIDPKKYGSSLWAIWSPYSDGRFKEVIDAAAVVLANHPGNTEALRYICSSYAASGQIAEARKIAERLKAMHAYYDEQMRYAACDMDIALATGNRSDALRILKIWESDFPDKLSHALDISIAYATLGNFDRASDWFLRAYERRESDFFAGFFLKGFGYEKAIEMYRQTAGYKALAERPLFKKWQVEHERVAEAIAAHRDPLAAP